MEAAQAEMARPESCNTEADTSSLAVRSPRTAANATFAFTPASILRRFVPI